MGLGSRRSGGADAPREEMSREAARQAYDNFGTDFGLDDWETEIDEEDLQHAELIGHVLELTYLSNKEGEPVEYTHKFTGLPALFELGVPDGAKIEVLESVPDPIEWVAPIAVFLELVYRDPKGDEYVIDEQGVMYLEPETGVTIIETDDGQKFAFASSRVDDWYYG